jgi:hypothetical protein
MQYTATQHRVASSIWRQEVECIRHNEKEDRADDIVKLPRTASYMNFTGHCVEPKLVEIDLTISSVRRLNISFHVIFLRFNGKDISLTYFK